MYLSLPKPREKAIGEALKAGFEAHGDAVTVLPTAEYAAPEDGTQIACVIGIKGKSKRVFEDHIRSGRHALLVDKSYFGRAEFLRLSLDGFQPHYAHEIERPHDRLERMGVKFRPLRAGRRDSHVIYAGSSQKYCDWHGLGDATEYAKGVCHQINKAFGSGDATPSMRRVLYRPKPSWVAGHPEDAIPVANTVFSGPDVKLDKLLPDCWALVTHGSNAAVEAVVAGVPVVVVSDGACAAQPMAGRDLQKDVYHPKFPKDDERRQWAADLCWLQWTIEEIASGAAWASLQPHTWKPMERELRGASDLERVKAQYRLMHEHPDMMRGRLADVFAAEIATLCHETGAETLLDYGSGKGQQYRVRKQHEKFAFPEPRCYDPGVPGLDEKPAGPFDGVLCLDVMEHVPEAHVDEVLGEIFGLARKFVYLVIFTDKARKHLPDGRNCHLTQKPAAWWDDRIARHAREGLALTVHYKGAEA